MQINIYVKPVRLRWDKHEKNLYKFQFSGESQGGLNNKVLEKLRNQEMRVRVN